VDAVNKKQKSSTSKSDKKTIAKHALSRRSFLGGATAGAVLAGCSIDYPWEATEAREIDTKVVRAAIYPGIGVARVGNSTAKDGFFIAPEVSDPQPTKAGQSHDAVGALKRQAARFRIYGYNAAGEIVRELTSENSEIIWEVELANKKSSWYRFLVALDIPEATQVACPRRNAKVTGDARGDLEIQPGKRTVSGKNVAGASSRFEVPKFKGGPMSLGELRTDSAGRLLVLGGLGKSASPESTALFVESDPDSFNNADGWYDDIADGPVDATVRIDGSVIPVDSSWVIVGPPNYAPDMVGWRTLYDLLVDTYVDAEMLTLPTTTSFTRDILPILQRLSKLQWVNQGFFQLFGKGTAYDFESAELLARLSRPSKAKADVEMRAQIASAFRPNSKDKKAWPPIYGDAYGTFEGSERTDLSVSKLRQLHLKRWEQGEFVADWKASTQSYKSIDDVPLGQRPAMLDRAALETCLADAFHPGCEVTWPMRHATLYRAPFRVKRRQSSEHEENYGETLTAAIALREKGPLHAQGPGDLTRWMALPWQGDTAFCRSGYEPDFDPYLQTFWPARVPNHVLSEADYTVAVNPLLPRTQRLDAFGQRVNWVRGLVGSAPEQMQQMVTEFHRMGVVEARPGVANDPELPAIMFVESLTKAPAAPARAGPLSSPPRSPTTPPPPHIAKAGWRSEAELEEFRKIKRRRRK
jgi:hypothetical protein